MYKKIHAAAMRGFPAGHAVRRPRRAGPGRCESAVRQRQQVLAAGKPASFAGNSLFWSNTGWGGEKFYNASVVRSLKTDWNTRIVRAAMGVEEGGGYLQDAAGNKARVKAVVEAAIATTCT